jgi:hypothetical protein
VIAHILMALLAWLFVNAPAAFGISCCDGVCLLTPTELSTFVTFVSGV